MEENIFIYLCKNLGDYKKFRWKYSLNEKNSHTSTIKISDFSYRVCVSNNKLTIILFNKAMGTTPWQYLGNNNTIIIEQVKNIVNAIKTIVNGIEKNNIVFVVHWGGEEAKRKQPDLELNSVMQKQNNNQFRFASFTGGYYETYNKLVDVKTFLLSQIDNKKIEIYEAEILKKKTINLWLPLAIDIQGLSEPETKNKKKYFEEVQKELQDLKERVNEKDKKNEEYDNEEKYYKSLSTFTNKEEFPRWEEIQKELKKDYEKFDPTNLVKALCENDYENFLNDKACYLSLNRLDGKGNEIMDEDNNKPIPNPAFIPNWLKEVVNVLDEKINQNK